MGLYCISSNQFVAKHHRAGSGGSGLADLEGVLGDLAGQPVVVHQVIEQMAQAADQAVAPELNSSLIASGLSRVLEGDGIVGQGEALKNARGRDRHRACRFRRSSV